MTGPGPGVPFTTVGGPGSIFADLDSITQVIGRHEEIRGSLQAIATNLLGAGLCLTGTGRVSPSADRLETGLREGEQACRALAERVLELHRTLSEAVDRYRAAEQGAAGVVDAEDPSVGALGVWTLDASRDGLTTTEAEFILRQAPDALLETAAAKRGGAAVRKSLPRVPYIGPVAAWAGGTKQGAKVLKKVTNKLAGGLADLVLDTPIGEVADYGTLTIALTGVADVVRNAPVHAVASSPTRGHVPEDLDGGMADLLALIPDQDDPSASITVTKVVDEVSGTATWVVGLPGTQPEEVHEDGGSNWMDPWTNADAYAQGSARAGEGIAEALAMAGVPDGSAVVFAGYSAGGLHALNMTGHPAVASRWSVRGAVSVGSPSGRQTPAEGVTVMSFERAADLTTALDGGPNGASATWSTVTFADTREIARTPVPGWEQLIEDPEAAAELAAADPIAWAEGLGFFGEQHALAEYREDALAYDRAAPDLKIQEQGSLDVLADLTRGTVEESATVTLRRDPVSVESKIREGLDGVTGYQGRAFMMRSPVG